MEQGPNLKRLPEIHQIVIEELSKYQDHYGHQPGFFSRVEEEIEIPVSSVSKILTWDVCWRFLKVGNVKFDLYDLGKQNREVELHRPEIIREYSDILFDLINYRWTQKLEEFNISPRNQAVFCSKVLIYSLLMSIWGTDQYIPNPDVAGSNPARAAKLRVIMSLGKIFTPIAWCVRIST